MKDPYYDRSELSNSDLHAFWKEVKGIEDPFDPTEAYRFGTLIDCIITEPNTVDHFKLTCGGEQYTKEDFEKAIAMQRSFMKDDLAKMILLQSTPQEVMVKETTFNHPDHSFTLPCRCKWDFWMNAFSWGADLKSTTATTQKQFEEAARHFDYDQQRFFYMNIAGSSQDMLIGISKINFNIFKIPIKRGDDFWKSGQDKVFEKAYQYWRMFGNIA